MNPSSIFLSPAELWTQQTFNKECRPTTISEQPKRKAREMSAGRPEDFPAEWRNPWVRTRAALPLLLRISQTGINRLPEAHSSLYHNRSSRSSKSKKPWKYFCISFGSKTWPEMIRRLWRVFIYPPHCGFSPFHCTTINGFDNKGFLRTHWG